MKKELCVFSGSPIHPGHGMRYVPAVVNSTKPILAFSTRKCRLLFIRKRNPRKIAWTVLYRRLYKKGITEDIVKKRSRRTKKIQRPIVGADLDNIRQKKAARPEIRLASREAALKELQERKSKAGAGGKKAGGKTQHAAKSSKQPVAKPMKKGGR
eukprot:NODE_661_length_758_cov_337.153738_g596_i0.p1 GENE.NODE_661_length_758_cov_337.153738_g596_i0~~NODE_661_length_758_cov_337.153738_g596_i0.p1  ORF type:complete len:155 (+),score=37.69 NODE_661_length_758_cov_337.153738_g596_i0:54-518(+)